MARHDIPLIENDVSGEIYFGERRPSVAKAYDRKGQVMLCSSFSKDLCPGYRVGWVAPGGFKSSVERQKFASTLATATLPQLAITQFLAGGGYDQHLRRIRGMYSQNSSSMCQAITRFFPNGVNVTRPEGGYVLWVELPEHVDSLELYRVALNAGIALAPGPIFSARQQYRNFIRLSAAFWTAESRSAVKNLGQMVAALV